MYQIVMYQDARGRQPVQEFIDDLRAHAETNKNIRVRLNKILDCMDAVAERGTHLGMPQTRHIEGYLWELRPTSDRIFYFCHTGKNVVLLHHYHKKTQKTPRREIEQALRNMRSHLKEKDHDAT